MVISRDSMRWRTTTPASNGANVEAYPLTDTLQKVPINQTGRDRQRLIPQALQTKRKGPRSCGVLLFGLSSF